MRWLAFLLLVSTASAATAAELMICYNYGCATEARIELAALDLIQLDALFDDIESAESERISIGLAVGLLNTLAGAQTPITNDRAENDDDGLEGRMDCIDHSITATRYLRLLQERGLLHFHEVQEPVHRAPYLINSHWAARIEDKATNEDYAVDAWFFGNGHPAAVIPLIDWKKGKGPK